MDLIKPILLSSTTISHHWFKQLSMTSDCYMNIFILIKYTQEKPWIFCFLLYSFHSVDSMFFRKLYFWVPQTFQLTQRIWMLCRWENALINKIINLNIKNLNVKWWNILKRCEIFCPEIWGIFFFDGWQIISSDEQRHFFLTLGNQL